MKKGYKLRETRQASGKTQSEIAEILQTTTQQYGKYERGEQELPARHVITLCKFYKISADYLLGIEEDIRME